MKKLLFVLLAGVLFTACAPQAAAPVVKPTTPLPTRTSTPAPAGLWISPAVPDALRQTALSWSVPIIVDSSLASMRLDVERAPSSIVNRPPSIWIYALAAPFPTVTDGVTLDDLRAAWGGSSSGPFAGRPLWMAESTLSAFTALWGAPAGGSVKTAPADQLLDLAWKDLPSWAIIPFESVQPKWKVLTVDGQSPIRKDFDVSKYPLQITFALQGAQPSNLQTFNLQPFNRDPSKMTTLIMTGTTALVRWIAYKMEINGVNYPGRDIGDWLRQADIFHISNEVSFDPNCPPPNPYQSRFYCSDPKYIQLLDDVGVDVVELTGNHNMDNGASSALYTLSLYKQHGISTFGGGANAEDARKPLLLVDHGNKFAFVGCNDAPPPEAWATTNSPGANHCNYEQFTAQISQLRAQGYLVIATFQYREGYSPEPMPWQVNDFRKAADAGAAIVSGSQSHFPLAMEFYNGAFIHYGLGNLFFDQMGNISPGPGLPLQPGERREFIDRYVFYDGRYISTELLTAMLEDYSRPRPMTADERASFLNEYFGHSGWLPLVPTPAPAQTATIIPLPPFVPLPTHTPTPRVTPTP
ncbi:MAG: CapA family protein [Chloroflexi bacterium]|nr:CapA family protein [Chloroflexota bacterium]MBI3341006.1 CapA family protein [Chloroflexota bacterium]